MADSSGWHWRKGTPTGDASAVAALRNRVGMGISSQLRASDYLTNLMREVVLGARRFWTTPTDVQSVALSWWLTLMYWQWADRYLAFVPQDERQNAPTVCLQAVDMICRRAESSTIDAISAQSRQEVQVQLSQATAHTFPDFVVDEVTCESVWAVCEATYHQVDADLKQVMQSSVPNRFKPVLLQLQQHLHPSLRLMEYYMEQWLTASARDAKLAIVERAIEPTRALFHAAQQLWALYLLGDTYAVALHKKLTLEDLDLDFDPLILTDPDVHEYVMADATMRDQLAGMWAAVPDTRPVLALQLEILAAHEQGRIRLMDGHTLEYCPWVPVWVVWRDVTIGGVSLTFGDMFALYVGLNAEGKFVSEIQLAGEWRLGF